MITPSMDEMKGIKKMFISKTRALSSGSCQVKHPKSIKSQVLNTFLTRMDMEGLRKRFDKLRLRAPN